MSDPPRRWPSGGGCGGGGDPIKPPGGFGGDHSSCGMKRPRPAGSDTTSTSSNNNSSTSSSNAAAQEADAIAPNTSRAAPNIHDLRRTNARRWEEVVRLRRLLMERQQRVGRPTATASNANDTTSSSSAAAAARVSDSNISGHGSGSAGASQLAGLDRRLAAHRSELALLVGAGASPAADHVNNPSAGEETEQQQQQHNRNVQSILAHRSMIEYARIHHGRIFGNEILETYDGLLQVNSHLDRTIGRRRPIRSISRGNEDTAAESNSSGGGGGGNSSGDVVSLYDRIAEAEARVAEHRMVRSALLDMLERRGIEEGSNNNGTEGSSSTTSAGSSATTTNNNANVDEDNNLQTTVENEAGYLRSELAYFAQQFDAHLDRMERVAATSALEAREGDVLSSDEEGDEVSGARGGSAQPTSSSSSSSLSQQPFLATLFIDLARRLATNREDPYVSVETAIGTSSNSGNGSSWASSSRNRRIERRQRIVDQLLNSGALICHPDDPDMVRFADYLE